MVFFLHGTKQGKSLFHTKERRANTIPRCEKLRELLCRLLKCDECNKASEQPYFKVKVGPFVPKGGSKLVFELVIPKNMKAHVSLPALKADGTPAAIDGSVSVAGSDSATAEYAPISADGLEFFVVPSDTVGATASLVFTADALVGAGVIPITATINVIVADETAVAFGFNVAFESK